MDKLLQALNKFADDKTIEVPLKPIGSWPETKHAVEKEDVLALIAAMGSERALLLTGDAGVGKSSLARVCSSITERYFISTVIKPDDEIGDLLWSIDHTQRLSDAQLAPVLKSKFDTSLKPYLRPGPIWHAFKEPDADLKSNYIPPEQTATRENGVVLLIDEIDKANLSLLHSLLEVLGNMSFEVPILGETIRSEKEPPIIILTSNGDQDLPEPLLRRCVCHTVSLPTEKNQFIDRMKVIAKAQMGEKYLEKVAIECAKLIYKHRSQDKYSSGASEFVDLIHALQKIAPNEESIQLNQHLKNISTYFIKS